MYQVCEMYQVCFWYLMGLTDMIDYMRMLWIYERHLHF